jgi:hypothetical protein
MAKTTTQSLNYNAIASQISGSDLLSKFDFVNIKQNGIQITAADSAFANGGTTSLKAGAVNYFNTPAQTQGSVSVKGNGQQIAVSSNPTAALAPIATANALGMQATANASQSNVMWYIIGGAIAVVALLVFLKK